MVIIKVELVNTLLYEDLLDEFKEYEFNLNKDLLNAELSKKDFERILKDSERKISGSDYGDRITCEGNVSVYKLRLKDEKRKIGARSGYRFIYLMILGDYNKAIPFHLYCKHVGKKSKDDLSEKEKKNVKKLVSDFNKNMTED